MEAVAEFCINLARVVPVEAAEGYAVVELEAAIGYVHGVHRRGEALAEIFSQRQIERGVLWQVVAGIRLSGKGVGESRAVVDVGGGVGMPRQGQVAANV